MMMAYAPFLYIKDANEHIKVLESQNVALLKALKRLRNAETDCVALVDFDKGFEDWADVEELKEAQAQSDEAIRKQRRLTQ